LKIIKRNKLRRGGFAGLRETRMVMGPSIFHGHREAGTSTGIGRFCYLADARFLPHGDTRMHTHSGIDIISIMVEGRLKHEGSLGDGQELKVDDIQVQRAGDEGFSHNEINPDDSKNRMIQLWVIPETQGEPATYQLFQAKPGQRTRVYGGPSDQDETIPSRTVIDVAHIEAGEKITQPGRCLVYITSGAGASDDEKLREGDLVETRDFNYQAKKASKLILSYEL